MADLRIVDVSTILAKWHDLLAKCWPNFPCQTFQMFMHNNSQELVRCKDCVHIDQAPAAEGYEYCVVWDTVVPCNGFCYQGAKMDGGAEE